MPIFLSKLYIIWICFYIPRIHGQNKASLQFMYLVLNLVVNMMVSFNTSIFASYISFPVEMRQTEMTVKY